MTEGNEWSVRDTFTAAHLAGTRMRERRAAWRGVVDNVILPTLEEVKGVLVRTASVRSLGVYVMEVGSFENFAAVQLSFGAAPTGIAHRREFRDADGRPHIERSIGVERGAALVFSQGETGRVVAVGYPFSTELPKVVKSEPDDAASRSEPWIGPIFDPEELTREVVADVCADFVEFARTTSIFWDGPPTAPRRFRRPSYLAPSDTQQSLEEILRTVRRHDEVVRSGIPQILTDLERLLIELDEKEERAFLEDIQPIPRRSGHASRCCSN